MVLNSSSIRMHLARIAFVAVVLAVLFGVWFGAYEIALSPTFRYEGLHKFVAWCIAVCYVLAFPFWLTWTSLSWAKSRLVGN